MDYKYDIFLSYRRIGETSRWISDYFIELLKTHLGNELGEVPKYFLDTAEIESGNTWPVSLGNAVASSKILIAFWSAKYLESQWCCCEIGHMLERELKFGFRRGTNENGLIFIVVIHDGEKMPVQISVIQSEKMIDYFKLTLNKDSQKYTEFEDKIKSLSAKIANSLNVAPKFQKDWKIEAVNSFVNQLHISAPQSQSQPPKFSNP